MLGNPINMQAPLARRRALIQKLMSQMASVTPSPSMSGQGLGAGTHVSGLTGLGNPDVVQNIQRQGQAPVEGETQGMTAAPVPVPVNPGVGGPGGGPVPPTQTPAWQTGGYVSEEAMNAFNGLQEPDQIRVIHNPAARRRYFL